MSEILTKLRNSLADVVKLVSKKMDEMTAVVKKESQDQQKSIKMQENALMSGLKGVERAIKDREVTDEVYINNADDISGEIVAGLNEVVATLKEEVSKFDKEVVINSDFSKIEGLLKDSNDKKDIITALEKLSKDIKGIKFQDIPDYTELLIQISSAIGSQEVITPLLDKLLKKEQKIDFPEMMNVELNPNLVDNDRLRTILPDDQVAKMSRMITDSNNSVAIVEAINNGSMPDENNSTTTTLLADATFTGTSTDILHFSAIAIMVYSDVASADDGMTVEFSADGINWHSGEQYTITAGATKFFTPPCQGHYMRVVYINGASDQTEFHLHTILHKRPIKWSAHNINDPIKDEDDAELVKAVITGKKVNGDYDNVSLTNGANMKVSLEELESGISSNSNSQLNVTLFDEGGIPASVDDSTETLQTIEYEHHEIHSGSHYYICGYDSFTNGQVVDFTVVVPNVTKWPHMTFSLEGSGALSIEIHEGATVDTTGTAVTAYNNNRNSDNTSNLTIRTGDAFTSEGTLIYSQYKGANKQAGFIERDRELVLKQNTTYIFRITNETALANIITWCAEWYEHTDKN
jgi:hypothetical protein